MRVFRQTLWDTSVILKTEALGFDGNAGAPVYIIIQILEFAGTLIHLNQHFISS